MVPHSTVWYVVIGKQSSEQVAFPHARCLLTLGVEILLDT